MYTGPATTVGPIVQGPLKPRAYWYWIGGLLIAAGVIGASPPPQHPLGAQPGQPLPPPTR